MSLKAHSKKHIIKSLLISTLTLSAYFTIATNAYAQAGVFEVVHPDVKKGETEIELLNGFSLDSIEDGEEDFAHEFAIGYGFTDSWKLTAAVELVNIQGEDFEVEGFELESLVLLPWFGNSNGGHSHDHDHDHSHGKKNKKRGGLFDFTLGFFTALEVPEEDGFDEGALEFGPVAEGSFGPLDWVSNIFIEVPFGEEDPGLALATQVIYPINNQWGIGVESFSEFEGLFGDGDEEELFAGPSLYYSARLGNGHVIEPRISALFGLNDESADAVLSLNIEYKFGGK